MSEIKTNKTIQDLREVLFETIAAVKSGAMDIDRAKCISDLAQVMTNTAKVEVQFMTATGAARSGFLSPEDSTNGGLPPGILGVRQHRIQG